MVFSAIEDSDQSSKAERSLDSGERGRVGQSNTRSSRSNRQSQRPLRSPTTRGEGDANGRQPRGRHLWHFVAYVIVALVALYLFQQFILGPLTSPSVELDYSTFKAKLAEGQILTATIGDNQITGTMKDPAGANKKGVEFRTYAKLGADSNLVKELQDAGVHYKFSSPSSPVVNILISLLPFVLIGVFWYLMYGRIMGGARGAGGIFGVGKSKATRVMPEQVGVTFKDVGGADEAIAELREIIEFLKNPEQFARLGGRIPKGVLLVGPPGTGKTLLAKATAGEAGVPFFESSGSEFVEMFVGVGAARVRDLFEQARKVAPAIVFIDEIDAIGKSRAMGITLGGANDEREQTLNQLLAEIDGFSSDTGRPVIIMAATNRPEVLDPALLRPGRFDRQIEVGNPDLHGRIQILKIHSRGIKLAPDFDIERAARITPGFSGADLANTMNEAALLAARRNARAVTMADFEAAMERVIAGLEKKTRAMNEHERRIVAYHEAGHALVAGLLPHADPVAKISIIPRARGALGYTLQMPAEDRYILTREELLDRIAVMLGGRAAERLVVGTISTGATDDIQKATELARRMVVEFGMSETLGSVRYAGQQLQYLAGGIQEAGVISPSTQELIDREVKNLVTEQYERAVSLLTEHRQALEYLANKLLREETLEGSVVQEALEVEGQKSESTTAEAISPAP